jgi:hypothetical protein
VTPRQANFYRRSSRTGLTERPEARRPRARALPASLRRDLEALAAAQLAAVGPPPPVQLYRTAKQSDELVGPLLHVGVGLDMLRYEHERALRDAAVAAVRANYSPAQIAKASGLDRTWLRDQRR